jgi:precorrin-6B methylase 1
MNPNASECARGRATGRIVSAALSFAAFIIATKIASIESKAANAKAPWKFVSVVKAWVTPAIYDLLETLVKGRRTIAFIARNPGQALQIGKFLLFKGLKTVKSVASEAWESAKHEVKELVEKIESGAGRIEDFASMAVERLKDFLGFHDELT